MAYSRASFISASVGSCPEAEPQPTSAKSNTGPKAKGPIRERMADSCYCLPEDPAAVFSTCSYTPRARRRKGGDTRNVTSGRAGRGLVVISKEVVYNF